MATDNANYRVKRKLPIFTAQQKEMIRQEVLNLLKANPAMYLTDAKNYLVTKYGIADQTAYLWLRHWSTA